MDRLNHSGRRRTVVFILLLLVAAVGIGLFQYIERNHNAGVSEGSDGDTGGDAPGIGENNPLGGIPLETSEEGGIADNALSENSVEEASDMLQFPHIIQNDLTMDIDYVFMREGIYCVYNREAWIYITQEGEALTPDSYTVAYPFREGLACVCKEGKYGFIDTEGRTAIDFKYDRAAPFVEGLAYFCGEDGYGFMDRTGTPLFYLDCDSVSNFQEGLACISVDGRYGYIDRTGEIVIAPAYDSADYFQDGCAEVCKDNKLGVIDRAGKELVPVEYRGLERRGDCFIGEKDGKYHIFDSQGNALLAEPCEEIAGYDEIFLRYEETGIRGFIHEGEAVLFDVAYALGGILHDRELIIAEKEGYQGVISFQGEVKIPFCYNTIAYDSGARVFIVSNEEGEKGLIDADDFSQRVMCSYRSIGRFINGQAVVSREGKYGTMDTQGNLILPLEYDKIGLLENGAYWFKRGAASYLFDADGVLLNVGNYDDIVLNGSCYVTQRDYSDKGLLNAAGEVILEPIYSDYSYKRSYYGYESGVMVLSKDYRESDVLVRTQEEESGAEEEELGANPFRYNEITPRISQFWELVKNASFYSEELWLVWAEFSEWNCAANSYKIYDFWHTGKPVLYIYCDPYLQTGPAHLGYSAFFSWKGQEAVSLIDGYECGGTAGGDWVRLWYDTEEGRMLLGTSGWAGGFGGESRYGSVYDYEDGEVSLRVSFERISQGVGSYNMEEYLENAELYYDSDDQPYTRETIVDAGAATGYYVNGELTTIEHYREVRERYQ